MRQLLTNHGNLQTGSIVFSPFILFIIVLFHHLQFWGNVEQPAQIQLIPPPPHSPRLNFEWLAWKLSIKNEISKSLAEMFSLNFIVSI